MGGYFVLFLLIFGFCFFIYWRFRKNFKAIVNNNIALYTGSPKTGKDALCCKFSHRHYKEAHRRWWWRSHFQRLLKLPVDEEPLFYTNAITSFGSLKSKKPHKLDKNIRCMSLELLLRQKRFAYKSCGWITEASLFADNMFFNDNDKNIQLSLFCKLFTHETKGGYLYLSTQNVQDLHYAFKRVCSNFIYIQKKINILNLLLVCYVRELVSNDLGSNNFIDDVDTTTRKVFVPFWWFKRYDRYQFCVLTDNLEVGQQYLDKHNLVVSFNPKYNEFAYADRILEKQKNDKKGGN